MPTFGDGAAFTHAIPPEHSKRASYKPTAEEAANAKASSISSWRIGFSLLFIAVTIRKCVPLRWISSTKLTIRLTATLQQKTMMRAEVGVVHLLYSHNPSAREEVMADNPFEIPQSLRDVSEQNLKQARAAYEQLMEVMTKAMGAWTGALPANPMAAVVKDVQDRAMRFREGKCRVSFYVRRKNLQRKDPTRDCDA